MFKAIVVFSQSHLDFRTAEFEAICDIFNIKISSGDLKTGHVFVLNFDSWTQIENILSRSILIKFACQYFFEAETYDKLYQSINNSSSGYFEKFDKSDESYALRMVSIGRKSKIDSMQRIKEFLDNVNFKNAPVDLITPKNTFYIVEVWDKPTDERPTRILYGKLLNEGQCHLKTKFNLKDRCYIGNTTMDPELSFIQANIAQIKPFDVVLDPFVGTGGLLLPAAEFGALVIGTEINYQTARAVGKSSRQGVLKRGDDESIRANFEQYGIDSKLITILIADSSKHGIWKKNPQFNAIVADPPYGVREKARKVGKKDETASLQENSKDIDYIRYPEKQEYVLENTYCDLLDLAASSCVIGGCISFWYPVILESYCEDSLPSHPAMRLISNCEQPLTRKSSRRLLTFRKIREPEIEESSEILKTGVSQYRSTLFAVK